jgi:hypothetical protein
MSANISSVLAATSPALLALIWVNLNHSGGHEKFFKQMLVFCARPMPGCPQGSVPPSWVLEVAITSGAASSAVSMSLTPSARGARSREHSSEFVAEAMLEESDPSAAKW